MVSASTVAALPRSPQISVIVPAYGVAHLVGEALASLQAQTLSDWEAIVIDDGAPDDVAGAFAPFAGDPRMRLLQTDNGGVSVARNRAISAARASYIALLDGDDMYEPDHLARMLAHLQADRRLGFVSCDVWVFGHGLRGPRLYSERYPIEGPVTLERVLTREVMINTTSIMRRSAFEAVGGYDERLKTVEDLDLWIRLLAAGWRGAVLPEPLARYRRRPRSLSRDSRQLQLDGMTVYRKAAASLIGRPEEDAALRGFAGCEQRLRWIDGEQLLQSGDVAGAVRLLDGVSPPTWRWRLALALLRSAPWLWGVLSRMRSRPAPAPAQRSAAAAVSAPPGP
jgi:glycosyltransferase involved in cell wall biosynthesis